MNPANSKAVNVLNEQICLVIAIMACSFCFSLIRSLFRPFGKFDPFIGLLGELSESEKEEVMISEDESGEYKGCEFNEED